MAAAGHESERFAILTRVTQRARSPQKSKGSPTHEVSKSIGGWIVASGAAILPLIIVWAIGRSLSGALPVTAHGELFLLSSAVTSAALGDVLSSQYPMAIRIMMGIFAGGLFVGAIIGYVFVVVTEELKAKTDSSFLFEIGMAMVVGAITVSIAARLLSLWRVR